MQVAILGVGLLAPGLERMGDRPRGSSGNRPYRPGASAEPEATLLPPNERRRSSDCVRWAVQVAQEAITQSGLEPDDVATVYASSGGEMGVSTGSAGGSPPRNGSFSDLVSPVGPQHGRRLLGHCHDLPAVVDGALLL